MLFGGPNSGLGILEAWDLRLHATAGEGSSIHLWPDFWQASVLVGSRYPSMSMAMKGSGLFKRGFRGSCTGNKRKDLGF